MASSAMSFSLAAGSLVVWCHFCFSVRLPSSRRCFFISFLSSSFSLPDVSFLLVPPGFVLTFVSVLSVGLSYLSSRLVCFAVGLCHSLLVPGSSFLLFSFSLYLLLLMPSFLPLAWWFFFCCLASARLVRFLWVVFRILFFCGAVLSLPYTRGCSCDAFVFLPSASSFFGYVPWRPCRHSSGVFVVSYPFLASFSCSSCCFFSWSSFTSFLLVLFLGYFSDGAPGFFAFSPLRHLPLLLLLEVLRLLLLLPLLSFMSLHAAFPASWVFGVFLFSLLSLWQLLLLLSYLRFHRSCSSPSLPVFLFRA